MARDLGRLERLLADDLTYTHSTAVVESRAQFLDSVRTGRTRYLEMTPTEVVVRLHGDVAIATGRVRMRVATAERELTFDARFTEVHVWRGGGWRLAAWQSTRLDA